MKALLMILIFFPGVLSAQVELDLQLCREMAIRNSKEMEIADRQHRKAMFDTKSYRADYLPKLSAVGVGFYNQKKYNYKLKGGYYYGLALVRLDSNIDLLHSYALNWGFLWQENKINGRLF